MPVTVRIGETVQASATATFSDGKSETLKTGWRSDTPEVATVTDAGLVTGVSNGRANIYVVHAGQQVQRNIRVAPDYQGRWVGTYRITSCAPFPSEVYRQFWCPGLDGTSGSISFTIVQSGELLNGQFVLDGISFPGFVTSLGADGSVQMTSIAATSPGRSTEPRWNVTIPSRGQMTGTTLWTRRGTAGLIGGANAGGTITAVAE